MTITKNHKPPSEYYHHIRFDVASHIAKGNHTILDIGCGSGAFGEYLLKEGYASAVYGLELIPEIADKAKLKLYKVICSNLNTDNLISNLNKFDSYYDYIVCADVLEHCVDPWSVLTDLVQFLKPNGKVLISVPNIRHWSICLSLVVKGEWSYREEGILDRTHLRFFTRNSLNLLVENAGLVILQCSKNIWGRYMKILNRITFNLFDNLLTGHYIIVCSKIHPTKNN